MKNIIVVAAVFVALCLCMTPVSSRDVIDNVPTIYIGEEHLNLKFLEDSESKLFGWWEPNVGLLQNPPSKTIDLSSYTDVSFPESEFAGYAGAWRQLDRGHVIIQQGGIVFTLKTPVAPPTPVPTPSTGNIVISSSPSDATVYVDNAIKGITPLTVTVANGEHVVRIRLYGYQESITNIEVNGEDVSIEPVMIPLTTVATTVPTTVPTTAVTTAPTTVPTIVPTTEPTVEPTTEPTTEPMGLEQPVNNNDTLAAIQSQIDEQATKNAEQDAVIAEQSEQIDVLTQIINFILSFLGVK